MPSVVLVTIDSLRADHVGYYGYDRDTTPVIDSLAGDGLAFDAYANASWTRASFPSIITSTYPLEYGGFEYLADDRTTVGEAVSPAGHATAAFHSNLWLSRDYNYDRGFDRFYDSKSEPSLLARVRTFLKLNLDHDGLLYRTLQRLYDTTEEKAGLDVGQTYKAADVITDRAIEWIERRSDPFVAWVHYMDVHHPYVPHDRAIDALDLDLDLSERAAIQLRRKMLEAPDDLTDHEHRQLVDLYDNEIRYTDRHVGRLLDAVPDPEDTVVLVTSDHGEELGDHGAYSHNPTMYEEVLHVPFVVSGGNVTDRAGTSGHQSETLELLDVAPTVCDLVGVDPPDTYRGRSALTAVGSGEHPRVISETGTDGEYTLALRADGWKYIWDHEGGSTELYDLDADPEETAPCGDEHPDVAAEFRAELEEHLADLRTTNQALPEIEMDTETEERLRNLGYLE